MWSQGHDQNLGLAGSTGFVATTGGLVVVAGAVVGLIRYAGGQPPERGLEGAMGALSLAVVVAAPGVLALLGFADRPALLLPAAVVLVPLSFLSFALVTLPLLIPATLLVVAHGRRSSIHPAGRVSPALTTVVVLLLLVAAGLALFVHDDPRSYSNAAGGGSTSDVISFGESLASMALVGAALTSGWFLAGCRQPRGG